MFKPKGNHCDNGATVVARGSGQIEVWGGAEYTRNRVGDSYFDQLDLSGHYTRAEDLAMFAELGIGALRCGMLWERHAAEPSWKCEDQYLANVQAAGLRPILGLLHHGSGPPSTSLLDPEFPGKLAAYAGEVAARYPWAEAYTPVNEPHTTARFACRYGVWYPHHASQRSFYHALLQQMKAVVLSMEAVRKVRPDAKLIQTDDLGKVWSTPELQTVSELLNERRWLPFDLLTGSVDRFHPFYQCLIDARIPEQQILWFLDHPCPPDVIGVNYYVTSDRFLDHRIEAYPKELRSAEGAFVDLEAARIRPGGIQGFENILIEAHQRYRLPVAITEVHLGDRVEEQMRWAAEAWNSARRAQAAGVDCAAVAFWALLGSYFWNRLVTVDNGHYEPGVFDLRSGEPRPTLLAEMVKQCARGETPEHEVLAAPGWWRSQERLQYILDAELVA